MSWQNQGRQRHGWFGHGTGPSKPKPHKPDTPVGTFRRNVADLTRVIHDEARQEGSAAMTAVEWTIRNRMLRQKKNQVDEVWRGYNHGSVSPSRPGDQAARNVAQQVATGILNGTLSDPTLGATNFRSPQSMPKSDDKNPSGDISGGLEDVPGVFSSKTGKHVENYRPGWSTRYPRVVVLGIPDREFKFYKNTD